MTDPEEKPILLVVDDDPIMCRILELALPDLGFEVCLAANGSEALDLYHRRREEIALVLLDLRMPYLGGAATLMALRAAHPGVCCCFMTGYGGDYDFDKLLGLGAATVIEKPFRLDDLASRLRAILQAKPS